MPRAAGPNEKTITAFEERFNKVFGAETMQRATKIKPYEVISTGSLALDYALGVGGYPEGRIVEIYGVDDIGKTTMALMAAREAQRKHPTKLVGYIDMEHKLDFEWAEVHGVNRKLLRPVFPDNAEQVSDMMKMMCQSGLFSMIILDSVGAMIPQAEHEKEADEATIALVAKIVTRMTKSNAVWAAKNGTCLLFINQIRANIGSYGAATTTTGGWALRFGSSIKIQLKRTDQKPYTVGSDRNQRSAGHELGALVERSKVSPKGRTAYISLITIPGTKYGPVGIDKCTEATDLGIKLGIIIQKGGRYTMPQTGEVIVGRDNVTEYLRTDPGMVEYIRTAAIATREDEVIPDTSEVDDHEGVEEGVEAVSTEPIAVPESEKDVELALAEA